MPVIHLTHKTSPEPGKWGLEKVFKESYFGEEENLFSLSAHVRQMRPIQSVWDRPYKMQTSTVVGPLHPLTHSLTPFGDLTYTWVLWPQI